MRYDRKNWSVKNRVVENLSVFVRRDRLKWMISGIAADSRPIRNSGLRNVSMRAIGPSGARMKSLGSWDQIVHLTRSHALRYALPTIFRPEGPQGHSPG